jgi:hypothetical protein
MKFSSSSYNFACMFIDFSQAINLPLPSVNAAGISTDH